MPWLLVGKYKQGGIKKRKKKALPIQEDQIIIPVAQIEVPRRHYLLFTSWTSELQIFVAIHSHVSSLHNFFRFAPPQILFPTPPKKKKGCPDQGCIDLEGYPCKRLSPVFATKSNHLSCRLAPLPPNTHQLTSRLSTRPLPILHNLLSFTSAHKSQQSPLFPPAAIQNFSSISPRLIRHRPVQILPSPIDLPLVSSKAPQLPRLPRP